MNKLSFNSINSSPFCEYSVNYVLCHEINFSNCLRWLKFSPAQKSKAVSCVYVLSKCSFHSESRCSSLKCKHFWAVQQCSFSSEKYIFSANMHDQVVSAISFSSERSFNTSWHPNQCMQIHVGWKTIATYNSMLFRTECILSY